VVAAAFTFIFYKIPFFLLLLFAFSFPLSAFFLRQIFIYQGNNHLPEAFKGIRFGDDLRGAYAETFIGKAAVVIR